MTSNQGGGGEPSGREQLASEMRRLKEKSGLSYGRLAAQTHYSRSSWERFLNGKQLPTTVAVEEFATAMGADAGSLLDLLERATEAMDADEDPGPDPDPAPDPSVQAVPEGELIPPGLPLGPSGRGRLSPFRNGKERGWNAHVRRAGLIGAGALIGSLITLVAISTGVVRGVPAASRSPKAQGGSSASIASNLSRQSRPSPQNARPGCSEDTCLRRDPQAMDCQWDATTARETWLRGMHIELRYSEACGSVWGRVENGAVGDSVIIKDKYGLELSATIRVDRDTYTSMLAVTSEAPPGTVAVCGTIPKYHARECSPDGTVDP
ncbi:helix-turn-helix domain-containing protein [Streptomyces sp. NPDC056231]|uniref:helix-turn-helix domain-containing protein n=1 Tax=Streptomyces sp. NPDC056231 TaxID=3345755 RepID=UPI003AAEAEBE